MPCYMAYHLWAEENNFICSIFSSFRSFMSFIYLIFIWYLFISIIMVSVFSGIIEGGLLRNWELVQ